MTQLLYAALGSTRPTSDLYTVDPATGVMSSVGPIGYAMTGLAVDPTTGIAYGLTSSGSASDPRSLITVDLVTGAGTLIGLTASGSDPITDLAFDSAGGCFGQGQSGRLMSINKATGLATVVGGAAPGPTFGGGLSFNSSDGLYGAPLGIYNTFSGGYRPLYSINTTTGVYTPLSTFSGGPASLQNMAAAAMSFDNLDVLYAVVQVQTGPGSPTWWLCTIDVATGVITAGIAFDHSFVDAIVWAGTAVSDDFSITLTPNTLTIPDGSSDTSALTTTITAGSAQSVALSASGNPAGMTVSFAANPITSGAGTTVTVTVGPTVPSGVSYPITITGVGSLGATHAATLTVLIPGANIGCATATNLNILGTCAAGSAAVSNGDMPTTPAAEDPLSVVFGPFHGGPQDYSHQAWFKFTNHGPSALFRFRFRNDLIGHGVAVALGVFLNCPATKGSSNCSSSPYNEWIFDGTTAVGAIITMGAQLRHGETVWIEVAGIEGEINPALNGAFTISWQSTEPVSYDGFDDQCSPPRNPAVNTSPFVAAAKVASYARCGNEDFAAVRVDVAVGVGSLEVWHYAAGVRTAYPIAPFAPNPGASPPASGDISPGTPFAAITPNLSVLLRTDGTNVWLIYYESAVVANPYGGGTWQPWRVAVLHWNGAGFTLLGHDNAKTLNTGEGLAGVPMGFGALDAAAAAAESGVLHVLWIEGGNSSAGNRSERVAYSKWSTSALLSQADLILNTGGITTFPDSKRLVSQYLFANNADGEIRAFYGRPLGAAFFGTTPYTNVVEMWDVTAGTANIIRTVNLATFNAAYTALDSVSTGLRMFGGSRRACAPHVTPIIYLAMPVITSAHIVLRVNADGSSNFVYPEGTSASGHNFTLPYDIEDDGRNIYCGADGAIDVWSRACPGVWGQYEPGFTAVLGANTALDFFVIGDTLYAHAQPDALPSGRFAPIAWPVIRNGFICSVGSPITCKDAVFDGAPVFRNEA